MSQNPEDLSIVFTSPFDALRLNPYLQKKSLFILWKENITSSLLLLETFFHQDRTFCFLLSIPLHFSHFFPPVFQMQNSSPGNDYDQKPDAQNKTDYYVEVKLSSIVENVCLLSFPPHAAICISLSDRSAYRHVKMMPFALFHHIGNMLRLKTKKQMAVSTHSLSAARFAKKQWNREVQSALNTAASLCFAW